MKQSFKSRFHLLVIILFAIIAVEALLLLFSISSAQQISDLATDMQSIIIIFVFAIFVYLIVLYNYIPYRVHKALREVRAKIDEISNGNYYIDFDFAL
jgi:signal transduction histidine kinase